MPPRILVDSGSENKSVAEALVTSYRVQRMFALAYHSQSNGLVERGHESRSHCQFPLKVLQQAAGEMGVIPLACTLGGLDLCSMYDKICGFRISVWKGVLLEYLPSAKISLPHDQTHE